MPILIPLPIPDTQTLLRSMHPGPPRSAHPRSPAAHTRPTSSPRRPDQYLHPAKTTTASASSRTPHKSCENPGSASGDVRVVDEGPAEARDPRLKALETCASADSEMQYVRGHEVVDAAGVAGLPARESLGDPPRATPPRPGQA